MSSLKELVSRTSKQSLRLKPIQIQHETFNMLMELSELTEVPVESIVEYAIEDTLNLPKLLKEAKRDKASKESSHTDKGVAQNEAKPAEKQAGSSQAGDEKRDGFHSGFKG